MKYMLNFLLVCLVLLTGHTLHAQVALSVDADVPKAQYGTFALMNATFETVSQGTLQGNMLIENGKITAMGPDIAIPADAVQIDCAGHTVYPGMIDGGTRLGLVEISAVNITVDFSETGEVTPQAQALTAVNPNSVLIPVTRVSGVTTVLTVPQGGLFSGTAALIDLSGYTPEQMYAGFKAVVLNFPSAARRSSYDRRSDEDIKKEAEKALKDLNQVWDKAVMFAKMDSAAKAGSPEKPEFYPEMEALLPVVRGEAKLLVEVNTSSDISAAIAWVQERGIQAIFTGVAEGWRVAEQLADAKIPVVTGPVLSVPTRESDRYDRPYANAGLMAAAGVKVALRTSEAENVRNLPYHAGFAATYGLGREAALRAITLTPAEIFGVEKHLGSLEVGKQASLFVADGDPFETKTQVKYVFINGWLQPMDSRQTRLYKEFLNREPGLAD